MDDADVDIYVSAPREPGATVMVGDPDRLTGPAMMAINEEVYLKHLEAAGWTAEGNAGSDRYVAYRDQLISNSELFMVTPGTKAEMVEVRSGPTVVKILEGEHTGRVGWIASPWVRFSRRPFRE